MCVLVFVGRKKKKEKKKKGKDREERVSVQMDK